MCTGTWRFSRCMAVLIYCATLPEVTLGRTQPHHTRDPQQISPRPPLTAGISKLGSGLSPHAQPMPTTSWAMAATRVWAAETTP
jgi:hypothetical protein